MNLGQLADRGRKMFPDVEERQDSFFTILDGKVVKACFLGFCILAITNRLTQQEYTTRNADVIDLIEKMVLGKWSAIVFANDTKGYEAAAELASKIEVPEDVEIIVEGNANHVSE